MSGRPICVLAVPPAGAQCGGDGPADDPHALLAVSLLTYRQREDGSVARVRLTSIDLWGAEARAMIELDRLLAREHAAGATLIAYDAVEVLDVIVARARRHWLFDRLDLTRWIHSRAGVLDLAGLDRRSATLREACERAGILGAGALDDDFAPLVTPGELAELAAFATALLHAHHLSIQARSPVPLLRGWRGLLGHVARAGPHLRHCAGFKCDGVVEPDLVSMVGMPALRRVGR